MNIHEKTPVLKSRPEMEALVREIAALKLDEKQLAAGMDAEIQVIRDHYEARLGELTRALAGKTEAARDWAARHPGEFSGRRSIEFTHGVVGFRTGSPKLKTVVKWKWDGVLESLRGQRWGAPYIRVKEEINKEQIIAAIGAGELTAAQLRQAGAQVVREESFFVEPKLTRVETREVA